MCLLPVLSELKTIFLPSGEKLAETSIAELLVILLETLASDGIEIPKDLSVKSLSKSLTIPSTMSMLVENGEIGLFMLKLVEIIGSDEIKNLDPETLYFINNLLNKGKIKKVRNQILNLTLPLRV